MRETDIQAVAAGAAIHLTSLRKHYGDVHAVDGVDLTIAPGEVVALLGPNGAGKSTTVDMILGLSTPDRGEVRVFGRKPIDAVRAGLIGAMLQGGALMDDLTVAETVGMVAALHRRPMPVAEALRAAGVEELAGRRANKLSGGQKQRVRFAVALVSDPDLLILDEPTAAMDVGTRREFWQSMYSFTESGRTVVFATHYLEEADAYADRIILMAHGTVVADGPATEIKATVGLRTIRATLPGADVPALGALPGVTNVETRGEDVILNCGDSDAALRALLAAYPAARNIEVRGAGLEEAFMQLTGDPVAEVAEVSR
jgi:ABC-2 type transport system ATP-binding protein